MLNGRVLFDSHKRINLPSRDRKVRSGVPELRPVPPHLTVAQNIAFGMDHIPRQKRTAEVTKYLDQIDLTGLGDRYPHQALGRSAAAGRPGPSPGHSTRHSAAG